MDNKEKEIENQLGDAGFSFSDTMPEGAENAPQAGPESFDIDMSSAPAEETQAVQPEQSEPIAEEQTTQPTEEPVGESSLNQEIPAAEPVALDESSVSRYVSEKLGVEIERIDELSQFMQQLQQ